jgi:quinol monooxygenase YgiN
MAEVRLIVQFTADSVEVADQAIQGAVQRARSSQQEAGCLQFEVFRSVEQPERYALLELWESPEALAAHAAGMASNPPRPAANITRTREDYQYNKTS